MENASKALIIAGAILISILLISVGIMVMNSINDPIAEAGSSAESQAIEIFNSKFTAYMGNNMDYNTAKTLITTVNSLNGTAELRNNDDRHIEFDDIDSVIDLERSATYDIEITDENEDGYYDTVRISEHNN